MSDINAETSVGRRDFLGMLGAIAGSGVLGGCASVALTPLAPVDGALRLTRADHPRLNVPGGYLRIQPAGAPEAIYLVVLPNDGLAALSPICTHLGCTVDIEGSQLICPCHGSTYDRSGAVLRGPAERPLRRYPVTESAGTIVISLEGVA